MLNTHSTPRDSETLSELTNGERQRVYDLITEATQHFYSKGKLQTQKFIDALQTFYPLCKNDPLFLAKLATWASDKRKSLSKDLKLITVYLNALNDADGTPFILGGTLRKPNLRLVTASLFDSFNPKELRRLAFMRRVKWAFTPNGAITQHFPTQLRTALRTYLETMPLSTLKAHVTANFKSDLQRTFRLVNAQPSAAQAGILGWKQQIKRGIAVEKAQKANPFAGLTHDAIAEKIINERFSFRSALSALDRNVTIPILAALMRVAKPGELLVQLSFFEQNGLLTYPPLAEEFYAKLQTATNLDRLQTERMVASDTVKQNVAHARATGRRNQFAYFMGGNKRMFVAIDKSGSQNQTIETGKRLAAILCEVAGEENFEWGLFDGDAIPISTKPVTVEAAIAALYLYRGLGNTDCFANYRLVQKSQNFAHIFVWITDGGHTIGSTELSEMQKPELGVIIKVPSSRHGYNPRLEHILTANKIPFITLNPESLTSSNLVINALTAALKGMSKIIQEIMETPFKCQIPGV